MSMLRRPLTQLELCEDDIQWMTEQLAKKETGKYEEQSMEVDEPMDQSESPQGITRKNLRSAEKKKDIATTSTSTQCSRHARFEADHDYVRMSFTEVQTMTAAHTPVAASTLSLSTPVMNGGSSSDGAPAAPRLPSPQQRRRRNARHEVSAIPSLQLDTPDTPLQMLEDSPTPSDSPESPNAHLYATPSNPAASGGPSSNTRSQRH